MKNQKTKNINKFINTINRNLPIISDKPNNNLLESIGYNRKSINRWGNKKIISERTELSGNMVRRYLLESTNGKWENLMNKSNDNINVNQPQSTHKKTKFNSICKLNTTRTLIPELNVIFSITEDFFR